jgi:hypothetical protein
LPKCLEIFKLFLRQLTSLQVPVLGVTKLGDI